MLCHLAKRNHLRPVYLSVLLSVEANCLSACKMATCSFQGYLASERGRKRERERDLQSLGTMSDATNVTQVLWITISTEATIKSTKITHWHFTCFLMAAFYFYYYYIINISTYLSIYLEMI
jgi:hypothetical protein